MVHKRAKGLESLEDFLVQVSICCKVALVRGPSVHTARPLYLLVSVGLRVSKSHDIGEVSCYLWDM